MDSSSEDEFLVQSLKEAADQNFLKESFFSKTLSTHVKSEELSTNIHEQKCLQSNSGQKSDLNIFGVSDAFQNYVARNLNTLLEKNIKFTNDSQNNYYPTKNEDSNLKFGIRLLSAFDTVIYDEDENLVENNNFFVNSKNRKFNLKRRKKMKTSEINIEEAVVNHEWILSKRDTQMWFNRRKEAEFKYKKLADGTLIEQ